MSSVRYVTAEWLAERLPADPIEMTDAEIVALQAEMGMSRNSLAGVIANMRRMRDYPDELLHAGGGDNRWYYATYCSTPERRREYVTLMLTATAIG